jgi:transporter family-2 protein
MSGSLVWRTYALAAGLLLGIMIFCNGELARYTTPTQASMIAHGIGTVVAWFIWRAFFARGAKFLPFARQIPAIFYLAGIPGAVTVILASSTVNSEIGFSGTLALIILGQVAFGIFVDAFGWFGMKRREFNLFDFGQLLLTMTGTAILIFFAR